MYALIDQPSGNLVEEASSTNELYSLVREEMHAGGDVRMWILVRFDEGRAHQVASGDDLVLVADASAVVTKLGDGPSRLSGITTRISNGLRLGELTGDMRTYASFGGQSSAQ